MYAPSLLLPISLFTFICLIFTCNLATNRDKTTIYRQKHGCKVTKRHFDIKSAPFGYIWTFNTVAS